MNFAVEKLGAEKINNQFDLAKFALHVKRDCADRVSKT